MPAYAIAYPENHDTFCPAKTGEPEITRRGIIRQKALAYAFCFFSEALPSVYWHDYYDKPYHNGANLGTNLYAGYSGFPLKPEIDRLIKIRKTFLSGPATYLVTNVALQTDLFLASRPGNGSKSGAVLAINDAESTTLSQWTPTPWANTVIVDWIPVSGGTVVTTDPSGGVMLEIPARTAQIYAPTNGF